MRWIVWLDVIIIIAIHHMMTLYNAMIIMTFSHTIHRMESYKLCGAMRWIVWLAIISVIAKYMFQLCNAMINIMISHTFHRMTP